MMRLTAAALGVFATSAVSQTVDCKFSNAQADFMTAGNQTTQCCQDQLTLLANTVMTSPAYVNYKALISSCIAPSCGCDGRTPSGSASLAAMTRMCASFNSQSGCVPSLAHGMNTTSGTLNPTLMSGSNYTALCGETLPAATAAATAFAASNATLPPCEETTTQGPGPTTLTPVTSTPTMACALPNPALMNAGQQEVQCCTDQMTILANTVMTNPAYSPYKALIASCMAPGGCLCDGRTPNMASSIAAMERLCQSPMTCAAQFAHGLNTTSGSLNPTLMAGANMTSLCLVTLPAAKAVVAAGVTEAPCATTGSNNNAGSTTGASNNQNNANQNNASSTATTGTPEVTETVIEAKIDLTMDIPANKTATELNNDATFKNTLAAGLKKSLSTTGTVVITSIAFARRILMGRGLAAKTLNVDYTVTMPVSEKAAVYATLTSTTFAADAVSKVNTEIAAVPALANSYTVTAATPGAVVVKENGVEVTVAPTNVVVTAGAMETSALSLLAFSVMLLSQ